MAKRAAAPILLAGDRGPARCAACGENREFRTDRNGRTLEQCGCGYRTVERRSSKRNEPPKQL
ncbi:MAG TPA: hypothetical protein VN803_11965 [Gemmatimonadales bacterium]|nr:hypothetical protein [Gemmatimonadales bacterium]